MNMKRMRGRNHRPNGGGGGGGGGGFRNQQNGIPLNRNHVFDSSGPEMRVRGTAQQLYDKYQQLARDASSNGDRVTGEAYYQHAEHYFRIISAINQAQGQPNGQPSGQANAQPNGQGQHGQERGPQPQQSGYQDRGNGQNENRERREQNGYDGEEMRQENRSEGRSENRTENRQEPRQENRSENRQEGRRFEPRPRPEFQRSERPARPEQVADPRIDISSALEAELAAAVGELPAGFGEQPEIPAAPEPRAIPIVADSPPDSEQAAPVRRPRGLPRLTKPAAEAAKEDQPG
ncbi:MAG: hypothetical protein B7Z80_03405 [Rhodospirillales bacterium 20-64-7]|nr:MAG: hypothetical protein B7Z80_03405 [Rhodospirillales bacterium 20-64-7]